MLRSLVVLLPTYRVLFSRRGGENVPIGFFRKVEMMFDFVEHCSCVNDAKWVYLSNDTLSNGLCLYGFNSN